MDITVYGHTGFIGNNFCTRYQQEDDLWLPPRYSRRPNPYKKTDMLYLISTTHNYHVFDDPTLDVNTNLGILCDTLDSWRRNNPEGIFNYVSTWFVYGDGGYSDGYSGHPAKEDSPCNPKGFYSITKHCAEKLVASYAETYGLKYRIFRLCNILGKEDKGVSRQKNALQYLINEMKENRPIEIYGDGRFYRTYMDVDDCTRALHCAMQKAPTNEIFNIGTNETYFFIDLINYAHKQLNSKSVISFVKEKEFHKKVQTKSFRMDCRKIYSLGFTPHRDIYQTIGRLIR